MPTSATHPESAGSPAESSDIEASPTSPPPSTLRRRELLTGLAAGVAIATFTPDTWADDVAVPIEIQAELLVKVAAYSKSVAARVHDRLNVMVISKSGDGGSSRIATQMASELATKPTIAGFAHDEATSSFQSASALASAIKSNGAAIVYLSSGFSDEEIAAIAAVLVGVDVLTSAAVPGCIPQGIILGFDLSSGKPRLLCNLGQARRQNVELASSVLKLMRVYE